MENLAFVTSPQAIGHNSTTGSRELHRVGSNLFGARFLGVFAADQIPVPTAPRTYCIINLDKSTNPRNGSHWVARYTEGSGADCSRMYYDSYGRSVSSILPHVSGAHDTDLRPNRVLDQRRTGQDSKSCGQRCLAALMVAKRGGMQAFAQM